MILALLLALGIARAQGPCNLSQIPCSSDGGAMTLGQECGGTELGSTDIGSSVITVQGVSWDLLWSLRGVAGITNGGSGVTVSSNTKMQTWEQDLVNRGGAITWNSASQYFEVPEAGTYSASFLVSSSTTYSGFLTLTCWVEIGASCGSGTPYGSTSGSPYTGRFLGLMGGGLVTISDPSLEHPYLCCSMSSGSYKHCDSATAMGGCWFTLELA